MSLLPREEYVEQAYLFRVLSERMRDQIPLQELLQQTRYELLATTKLPMAVEFLLAELKHQGSMAPGMRRLNHYFAPFQTYLVSEAEEERGRFDIFTALKILQAEAEYRSKSESRQGLFFFHFETLCRNRLRYDPGLKAMSEDPAYDAAWREWLIVLRRQVGFVDLADLIYLQSEEYFGRRQTEFGEPPPATPPLFGMKEGRVAMANRGKDPLFLFAAMQRHLGYPEVPRPVPPDATQEIVPQLMRRVERLETRIKLMEEEQRHGIDITKFYQNPNNRPPEAEAL